MVRGIARMRDTACENSIWRRERGGEGRGGWKEGDNIEEVSQ